MVAHCALEGKGSTDTFQLLDVPSIVIYTNGSGKISVNSMMMMMMMMKYFTSGWTMLSRATST